MAEQLSPKQQVAGSLPVLYAKLMKLIQLAIGDILKLSVATEVILAVPYGDESLEKLLNISSDELDNLSPNSYISVTLPAGSSFKVTTHSSTEDRSDWQFQFQVLDWPPLLIEDPLYIEIPVDEFNKIEWCELLSKPQPIVLDEESEETESSDNLDFSHIK